MAPHVALNFLFLICNNAVLSDAKMATMEKNLNETSYILDRRTYSEDRVRKNFVCMRCIKILS